jgi:putative transposase
MIYSTPVKYENTLDCRGRSRIGPPYTIENNCDLLYTLKMVDIKSRNLFPQRKNPRLSSYDYSSDGAYFVTICSIQKLCIFGQITNSTMILNSTGELVETVWRDLPLHFPEVNNEVFIVMPNHIHGIISINRKGRADPRSAPTTRHALSDIVRAFKNYSSQQAKRFCSSQGTTIWQRGYYEHIIRGEDNYYTIGQYIMCNPAKWETDPENQQSI